MPYATPMPGALYIGTQGLGQKDVFIMALKGNEEKEGYWNLILAAFLVQLTSCTEISMSDVLLSTARGNISTSFANLDRGIMLIISFNLSMPYNFESQLRLSKTSL